MPETFHALKNENAVSIGLVTCHFADKCHLISLAPEVYTIAYVPFKAAPLELPRIQR